jgi:enoyl-CoA hydratase/carnithine racemase
LINDVVGAAQLLPAAEKIAGAIAMNGPVAVRLAKEAALRGLEMPLEKGLELESDLLTLAQGSEDAKEGVRAFLEKRKPRWTGR